MNHRLWKVREITLTTEGRMRGLRCAYPFWVKGTFVGTTREFYWSVPSVSDPGYDLTDAEFGEGVRELLEEEATR